MQFGVPFVLLYVPLAWLLILKLFPPEVGRVEGGTRQMLGAFKALGPLTRGEGLTLGALGLAAALWVVLPLVRVIVPGIPLGPLASVDEYLVGILVGVLMFVIPVDLRAGRFLLDWDATRSVEWGVLILFGGGLALSDAMFRSGLALWIASTFIAVFGSPPTVILVLAVMLLVVALTEIASNTAVATMMVPVAITIGKETGVSPAMLAVATGVASSLAFMLPVSTPPNAMVFSTGYISIRQMIHGGVLLDLIGWLLAAAVVYFLAGELLGIFPV
jgi:sodium-dependent dicarboxylate transporter 2/3/5